MILHPIAIAYIVKKLIISILTQLKIGAVQTRGLLSSGCERTRPEYIVPNVPQNHILLHLSFLFFLIIFYMLNLYFNIFSSIKFKFINSISNESVVTLTMESTSSVNAAGVIVAISLKPSVRERGAFFRAAVEA